LSPFCKLADPGNYVACPIDLSVNDEDRRHWIDFFPRHFEMVLSLALKRELARGGTPEFRMPFFERARQCLRKSMNDFAHNPRGFGRVTILTMARWRDQCLFNAEIDDAFADVKQRENDRALPLLPTVCRELDRLDGEAQLHAVIEGVFAGNIFDMGAEATANTFRDSGPDFFQTRKKLPDRPWLIDDFDTLAHRMLKGSHHQKAVFFVDNAGADFFLGVLPMIRWLACRGTSVVISVNERPTLNDMTVYEVEHLWPKIVEVEPSFASLPITLVSTGTSDPLIDLLHVSDALNEAAADADLVILEGMGRGVESNLDAKFNCDALNIAMIKDAVVARQVGGKLFDVACKFR